MAYNNGFFSTTNRTISYRVKFRCCFCQTENVDTSQGFEAKETVFYSMDPRSIGLPSVYVDEKLQRKIAKKQAMIDRRDYNALFLNCRCSSCKKTQPWSGFWHVGGTFRVIGRWIKNSSDGTKRFLAFMAMPIITGVIYGLMWLSKNYPLLGILVLCGLFLPTVLAPVHNLIRRWKVSKLPEEYHPQIEIRK